METDLAAVSDEQRCVEGIVRWLSLREQNRLPMPSSYRQLVDDVENSALLRRILSGSEPLGVAPPRSFGQPWYSLIARGFATGCVVTPLKDRLGSAPSVAINEFSWSVVGRTDDGALMVQYSAEAPRYVATQSAAGVTPAGTSPCSTPPLPGASTEPVTFRLRPAGCERAWHGRIGEG